MTRKDNSWRNVRVCHSGSTPKRGAMNSTARACPRVAIIATVLRRDYRERSCQSCPHQSP
jgi:hypothetical protein